MSEERGIGAALRAAREEKGWTAGDVGSRLRLMSRQIEAIEAEDFHKLGPPVFARGFVRNYAKLLGLDSDELLDQMTRVKTTTVQETENVPFKPSGEFWKSPWVLGGIAAVVLLIAIPVGLYLWLSSDDEKTAPPAAGQVQPLPPQPAPVPAAPATAPSTMPPTPAPASSAPHVPAPTGQAAPATSAPAPATTASLSLQFDEPAWVQVRDSSGRMVHSALNPAGSTVQVNGKAPFYLVVGNAAHVRVIYKGQQIDLTPFTSVDVARLTLNP